VRFCGHLSVNPSPVRPVFGHFTGEINSYRAADGAFLLISRGGDSPVKPANDGGAGRRMTEGGGAGKTEGSRPAQTQNNKRQSLNTKPCDLFSEN